MNRYWNEFSWQYCSDIPVCLDLQLTYAKVHIVAMYAKLGLHMNFNIKYCIPWFLLGVRSRMLWCHNDAYAMMLCVWPTESYCQRDRPSIVLLWWMSPYRFNIGIVVLAAMIKSQYNMYTCGHQACWITVYVLMTATCSHANCWCNRYIFTSLYNVTSSDVVFPNKRYCPCRTRGQLGVTWRRLSESTVRFAMPHNPANIRGRETFYHNCIFDSGVHLWKHILCQFSTRLLT